MDDQTNATSPAARAGVLMVDDRPDNLLALEAILQPLELHLVRASSGEEALKHLLNEDFAVILLDVQMPGMDGFETAAHIKQRDRTRDIPIIFLTAISREVQHQLRGYDAGAVDYLAKPFEPEVLRAKVAVFVDLWAKNQLLQRQSELLEQRLQERDRAQEALAAQAIELERSNAELEQFAHVVSHDLQEPLHSLAGFLELLADQHADQLDDDGKLYIERAMSGADRMRQLVRDLLEYARVSTRNQPFGQVDMARLVDEILADLHDDLEGLTVRVGELPTVEGDAFQLSQLIRNLTENAVKFRSERPAELIIGAERRGDEWLFSFEDRGIGIDPRFAIHVFTIFQRLHGRDEYAGTGVGLAISKKIVERHQGRIWVESEPGDGATFFFTLPARPTVVHS
jgi:two-component system, sensor histidine kinase and response regulator